MELNTSKNKISSLKDFSDCLKLLKIDLYQLIQYFDNYFFSRDFSLCIRLQMNILTHNQIEF